MGIELDVYGAGVMIKALASHDKVMYRHLTTAAKLAVTPILSDARMDSPVKTGAMRDAWQIKKMRSRASAGYPFGYVVRNMTRQGAILEHAGSASSGATPQGQSLISNMTSLYGPPGRFAWKAYDKRHVQVDAEFNAAVKSFEVEMNAKLGVI